MRRVILAVTLGALAGAALLRAQAPVDPPLDKRIVEWDQGPTKIDVSSYPPGMRDRYRTFADLCSRCHSLARAINCEFVLEDDWERYIKRMMRRGRTLITPAAARDVYEFATYDSKIRKKALYDRRLAAAQ
jgi:hypothetical protein